MGKREDMSYVIEAPSFNLGFEAEDTSKAGCRNMECDKVKEDSDTGKGEDNWDIDWNSEEVMKAFRIAEESAIAKEVMKDLHTPTKPTAPLIDLSSPRSTPIHRGHERRPIKLPPCKRSPFVNYGSKLAWVCSKEANEVYDAVLLHGRSNARDRGPDNR